MPMNKIPKLREPRGPIVQQVRDLFLENEFKETPEEFYLEDIRLIENMDFLLQRYIIMQRKNVDASVKMVSQMLKWRKEKKLYEMNDKQFPQELTICGAAFLYENDKFGNRTLYMRASMCKNCAELKSSMKDFLTYLLFKIDDSKEGTTFSVIMDLTNTTWSNYDLEILMHFVSLLKDYFPVNLDYVLAINFPWILSAAWSLIKRLIPAEKRDVVQFINSNKIFDFIEKEDCPDFLGGTCTRPYQYICDEAPTAIDYLIGDSTKTITKKRLREILTLFSDILPKDHSKKLKQHLDQYKDGIIKPEELISNINNNNNNNDNNNDSSISNNNNENITKMPLANESNHHNTKQKNMAK